MSEALLLLVIQKLDINYREDEKNENMERVIKEMKEIFDIVRDKKLEEGRTLNFLVSDLVQMADDALHNYNINIRSFGSIHSWIGEIKKQMLKLGDDEFNIISISENVDDDKYVVGLDEDLEMLLHKRIIDEEEYLSTVLIKGMCGIGKTTLAREIYNHPTVVKRFERRAWVSNSTHFTLKKLLIKLIQQVEDPQNLHTSSLLEEMDNRRLRYMLCQHLQGKRYLIVLDDVPKQMHLMSFLEALPQEWNGSRLLLTSHTTHIDIDVEDEDVHQMKPLDSKKSWQLFLKTINHGNKIDG
ncbi:putative disease resistance RPP13-like protein 2 [Salvia miltiorrhiza]|uniref:putative disease resistance RPP13-like protein 2 n=1 Tax=Salvia miltiorrhiza TaxID=226208 RepID=UPI0025ACD09D|nr:putative disease resistance RPP13-like protein 2 [Salvia miltiorrhiza]